MAETHILLVEDEQDLCMIVEDAFSDRGFTVTAARNGVEALRYLREPTDFSHLITDVSMPEGVSVWTSPVRHCNDTREWR